MCRILDETHGTVDLDDQHPAGDGTAVAPARHEVAQKMLLKLPLLRVVATAGVCEEEIGGSRDGIVRVVVPPMIGAAAPGVRFVTQLAM